MVVDHPHGATRCARLAFPSQSRARPGYCRFTSTSIKVRAKLMIFGTNGDVQTNDPGDPLTHTVLMIARRHGAHRLDVV
jgi:hypothetical protein